MVVVQVKLRIGYGVMRASERTVRKRKSVSLGAVGAATDKLPHFAGINGSICLKAFSAGNVFGRH